MTAWRRPCGLVLAAVLLHLVLIQPNHPQALTWGALRLFPLELPAILLAMVALPAGGWPSRLVRAGLAAALTTIAALKFADFAMFTAFARGFNPLVDLHLAVAGWHLASGAIGRPAAGLAVVAAAAALAALAWGLWRALEAWAAVEPPRAALRPAAGLAAVAAGALAVAEAGGAMRAWALPFDPPGAAFTARVGAERVTMARRTLSDLAEFRAAAARDAMAGQAGLLASLLGRDILVIFVESYGRASFDNPLYAPTHRATLAGAQGALAAAGMQMRTGWLAAPIEGGQSWLAHGTFASGLRTGDQTRYGALMASRRQTLWHIAGAAGYHAVAVAPGVVFPWPEARRLGFETVLDAVALDYRGARFNWVTMPDQFTLAVWRDRLPAADRRPVIAQIALISSHAPWVPVPVPVPWDAVGDGTVFTPMTLGADPPEVVWRDRDRVRDQYRQALDYSLRVTLDWAARQVDRDRAPFIIVLGDHPAAGFVSQVGSPDVPAHLIGPAEAMAPFAGWGWTPGLIPDAATPRWQMEDFRDRFLAATRGGVAG